MSPSVNSKDQISLNQMFNIDSKTITLVTNIGIHLLLLSFLMKAGFHLASLGTMLVRPIIVDVNAKNFSQKK